MAPESHRAKRSKFNAVTLFGGFFVLAGLFAFLLIAGPQLYGPIRTLSWQPVPAQALEVRGDSRWNTSDGTSTRVYSLRVNYSYTIQGAKYQAQTVSLDDSFDSDEGYWRGLETRVRRENVKRTLVAWVNPAQPEEAVLDRSVRWKKVFFALVFLVTFGGAGAGVIWLSRRQKSTEDRLHDSRSGIKPIGELTEKVFFFFGMMFVVMSSPVFFSLLKELEQGNYAILVVLLFPLVGLGFMVAAWKMRQKRRRFGPALLMPDPLPGCSGGQIGGSFEVFADKGSEPLSVHVECARIRRSRGKNSSNHKSVVWQEGTQCYAERSAGGSKHSFALDIPADLPPSETDGRYSVQWTVNVRGVLQQKSGAVEFNNSWQVPVVAGAEKSEVSAPLSFVAEIADQKIAVAEAKVAAQINVESSGDLLRLFSGAGRHGGTALVLLIMGLVFVLFGALAGFLFDDAGFSRWFFAVVFSLVGLLISSASLWSWGRSLDAEISHTELRVVRSLFGRPLYKRTRQLTKTVSVCLKESSSSTTSGQKTKQFFALMVTTVDGDQVLAEGIEGRLAAEALEQRVQTWLVGRVHSTDTTAEPV